MLVLLELLGLWSYSEVPTVQPAWAKLCGQLCPILKMLFCSTKCNLFLLNVTDFKIAFLSCIFIFKRCSTSHLLWRHTPGNVLTSGKGSHSLKWREALA